MGFYYKMLVDAFRNELEENKKLNDNDRMVGKAIIEMLVNSENLFVDIGTNKYFRESVLLFTKEVTNLQTKEIKKSMLKYRKIYKEIKDDYYNQ